MPVTYDAPLAALPQGVNMYLAPSHGVMLKPTHPPGFVLHHVEYLPQVASLVLVPSREITARFSASPPKAIVTATSVPRFVHVLPVPHVYMPEPCGPSVPVQPDEVHDT